METVYLETSIVSYLTAQPARDVVAAARQRLTIEWWDSQRAFFSLVISPLVMAEASRGDSEAALRRLEILRRLPHVDVTPEAISLAKRIVADGAMPKNAADDALHIALAVVHRVDYLLTWNCRHIDNAQNKPRVRRLCHDAGYRFPEICTPEELMGGISDAR
ncbi:MAG: type II toxin-antitoxin system VapC family toxin [Phycisphaerales bacterium]